MNDLEQYFVSNQERLIWKWQHYFEIYDRHFSRFRGTDVHVAEIGVLEGGSLQMWKRYFGPKAKIYGIDINAKCSKYKEDQVEVIIGNAEDKGFLKKLRDEIKIDILIDDGGHTMDQQITAFEGLFYHISSHGVYLCEDIFSSYQPRLYGGGYKKPGTFVEYSKNFIDYIHAWHVGQDYLPRKTNKYDSEINRLPVNEFTRSVHSLHYYDSILVIEKRPIEKPFMVYSGKASLTMSTLLKTIEAYPAEPRFFGDSTSDQAMSELSDSTGAGSNLSE